MNAAACSTRCRATTTVVIKLGGSILTGPPAYQAVASWLHARRVAHPEELTVAVVSAEFGDTDRLLELARQCHQSPEPTALDVLLSTGETRSVALLTLCLQACGTPATSLHAHQCGLAWSGLGEPPDGITVNPLPIRLHLRRNPVVVVPGFFACGPAGRLVSLGRGGSDLTAVLLAAALHADRCELIKDVPGYFDRDPHQFEDARPLPHLTFGGALAMAAAGCDLVQKAALRAAARTNTPLIVRALADELPRTRVSNTESAAGAAPARAAAG